MLLLVGWCTGLGSTVKITVHSLPVFLYSKCIWIYSNTVVRVATTTFASSISIRIIRYYTTTRTAPFHFHHDVSFIRETFKQEIARWTMSSTCTCTCIIINVLWFAWKTGDHSHHNNDDQWQRGRRRFDTHNFLRFGMMAWHEITQSLITLGSFCIQLHKMLSHSRFW